MKKANLRLLVTIGVLTALPGCTIHRQIAYDPGRMPCLTGPTGRRLRSGEFLSKDLISEMLADLGSGSLDPNDFLVDTDTPAHVFGTNGDELLTFVVLPDTQIEDRSLRFGPELTRLLDKKIEIETTVRGFYQDHADIFYLGFLLKSIRLGLAMNTNIAMVVHLGDAMQLGSKAELAAFNEMVGKFLIAGYSPSWQDRWSGTWLETPRKNGSMPSYRS